MSIESIEPAPLVDDERIDPLVRGLLAAGRSHAPARGVIRAAPAAIVALIAAQGVAVTAAAAAPGVAIAAAAPVPKAGAVATFGVLLKWLGVGLAVGVSTAGITATAVSAWSNDTKPSLQAPSRDVSPRVDAAPPGAVFPEPILSAPSASAPSAKPVDGTGVPSESLQREVRLLDEARGALAAGQPEGALRSLDQVDRLPRRSLQPEATVLRVRALLRLHRAAEAEQVARSWEARAPRSPQAALLRDLLKSEKGRSDRHADSFLDEEVR
jgi:hypothetical protein